ncbi:hypothetical protein C485_16625 [Natrinema altunense JCM 12890]|uniref:Uncharacterized protein n=1 Tax=Natrinema altunense (strain JCM 12890 / CGMCC 1.3731 / AJ2) TaxID=1227494 RepID=L9ZCA1_NATA2|nr:hypothetical protein C485_16625 [Natrinema altunense JCM 12890]
MLRETATDASDETQATVAELLDVVTEVDDLLETIDFETLPDAVDVLALPALVAFDEIPHAIHERDPALAPDLSTIRDGVELRALWNTVDLVDFQRELRQLKRELEDIVGPDAFEASGDSEAAAEIRRFVDDVKPAATNAALQQEAKKAARTARGGVIEGHSKFESLYESTGRGPGSAGRKPVSNNPTAVSSVPSGPLPDSVSTRMSTVPTTVRHAKIDTLSRGSTGGAGRRLRARRESPLPPRLRRRNDTRSAERENGQIGHRRTTAQRQY